MLAAADRAGHIIDQLFCQNTGDVIVVCLAEVAGCIGSCIGGILGIVVVSLQGAEGVKRFCIFCVTILQSLQIFKIILEPLFFVLEGSQGIFCVAESFQLCFSLIVGSGGVFGDRLSFLFLLHSFFISYTGLSKGGAAVLNIGQKL